jgi:hypothetical protein
MNPHTKRKYNLTYTARKKGIKIDGYKHRIFITFDEIKNLLNNNEARALINEYNFDIIQNKQLKLQLK